MGSGPAQLLPSLHAGRGRGWVRFRRLIAGGDRPTPSPSLRAGRGIRHQSQGMSSDAARLAPDVGLPSPDRPSLFSRIGTLLERRFEAERDQLPLWLPVGLLLGIALWFWLPDRWGWIAFLAASLAAALGFAAFAGATRTGRALAIFALAAAFGCGLIWWTAEKATAPRIERARMLAFDGRIHSVQTLAAEQTLRLVVEPAGEGMPARL